MEQNFAGNAVCLLRREKAVERRGGKLMEKTVEPRDSRLTAERHEHLPPYTQPYPYKMTIDDLPQEYRPIGMWGYFGYSLLFNIPFAGWIIALVFAFGVTSNVNLKNYARGYFCGLIVVLALLFLLSMGGCSLLAMM